MFVFHMRVAQKVHERGLPLQRLCKQSQRSFIEMAKGRLSIAKDLAKDYASIQERVFKSMLARKGKMTTATPNALTLVLPIMSVNFILQFTSAVFLANI